MSLRAYGVAFWTLAFLLRLPTALAPPVPTADAADYLRLASSLRDGSGYVDARGQPTAFRPPAYPLVVSIVGVFGLRACTVLGAALGALSCLLTVLAARRLVDAPPFTAWSCGLLLAVDPVQHALASGLYSEILYTPLLLAAVCFAADRKSVRAAALAGVFLGLGVLTRAAAIPVAVLLALWLAMRHSKPWRAVPWFAAAAALTVSPWLARNWAVLGAPVLTTQGGVTLYSSYNPPRGRLLGVVVHDEVVRSAYSQGEVAADRKLTREALLSILRDPWVALRLAVLKVAFFWTPVDWEVLRPGGRVAPVFLAVLPFAVIGMVRDPERHSLVIILFVGLSIFSAVAYGSPRLRLPYEPLLLLPATMAIAGSRRMIVGLWVAFAFFLFALGSTGKYLLAEAARRTGLW